MAKYKEVPDWWFLLILVGAVAVSIAFLEIYPLDVPVWLVFVLLGINAIFAVPLSFLSATTGTNLGLGSLVQIITGYALPNNTNAFLFGQTLGSWALAGYSDNYVQDQKLAHYCKIAPRAVFRSQIGTIIITCFVAVATQNLIFTSIPDVSFALYIFRLPLTCYASCVTPTNPNASPARAMASPYTSTPSCGDFSAPSACLEAFILF